MQLVKKRLYAGAFLCARGMLSGLFANDGWSTKLWKKWIRIWSKDIKKPSEKGTI